MHEFIKHIRLLYTQATNDEDNIHNYQQIYIGNKHKEQNTEDQKHTTATLTQTTSNATRWRQQKPTCHNSTSAATLLLPIFATASSAAAVSRLPGGATPNSKHTPTPTHAREPIINKQKKIQ
jgi:hypothetical protein